MSKGAGVKECYLCDKDNNFDYMTAYERYRKNDPAKFSTCKMPSYKLITNNPSKVTCANVRCNQIQIDSSEPGDFSYQLEAIGGPGMSLLTSWRTRTKLPVLLEISS